MSVTPSCLLRVARSAGDVFTDSTARDIVISGLNNTGTGALLVGFSPTGGVAAKSILRLDPSLGLVVNGGLSIAGQILQGGSNLSVAAPTAAAAAGITNTSNLVCTTLNVTNTLTLGSNAISFANGSGSAITAATWTYMQNYVYSGSTITPTVTRTLFSGVAQNHSAYVQNGLVYVFGVNDRGQLGLGDLVSRPLPTLLPGVSGAVSVACGQGFTVILLVSGAAVAMGNNAYGQLGDGTTVDKRVPTPVMGVSTASVVVTGYFHTLFLLLSGAVVGYGSSSVGQLGGGTTTVVNTALVTTTLPVATGSATAASMVCRAIDVGAYHSVLLLVNGSAYSFGLNSYGQLGLAGLAVGPGSNVLVPTLMTQASLTQVVGIGTGQFHTLLVLNNGTVLSCGRNDSGQCGVGNVTSPVTTWTVVVNPPGATSPNAGQATSVAAGTAHTVVAKADGTVWVFGSNAMGQLGAGVAVTGYNVPTQLLMSYAVYTAFAIAAGANHTVVLLNNDATVAQKNRIVAFGDNTFGQVGTPLPGIVTAYTPFPIYDGSMIYGKRLMAGQRCMASGFLDSDGTAYVWGQNDTYLLGDGTTTIRLVPTPLASFNFMSGTTRLVSLQGGMSMAALDSNGVVYMWGFNSAGQLGNNTTSSVGVPQAISSFGSLSGVIITSISVGCWHTLALDSTGAVHAWGWNVNGQLGTNSQNDSHIPVNISGFGSLQGKTIIRISTGNLASAAIDSAGVLHTWGNGAHLGLNISSNQLIPAVSSGYGTLVTGLPISAVSMGYASGIALDSLGNVHGWGQNPDGEIGDGTTTSRSVPVAISSISGSSLVGKTIVSCVCGDVYCLALDSTGSVHAWGNNGNGQIGNNTTTGQLLPINISSKGSLIGKTVVAVVGLWQHSMVMDSTGGIHVWGFGSQGQNGNNTLTNLLVPTLVTLNSRTVNVPMFSHGGLGDTKLLKGRVADLGVLLAVGANTYGQIGDGTTTARPNLVSLPTLSSTVTSDASGLFHSGATLANGSAYLWGRNNLGQCGVSGVNNVLTPTALPSLTNAASVYCGSNCSFVTLMDGSVVALGDNTSNQLGVSGLASASNTVVVAGLTNVVQLASGGGSSLALNASGNVYSWGTNVWGATGQGTLVGTTSNPTLVNSIAWNSQAVTRVAAGDGISALVTANGSCYTCGVNVDGGLGQSNSFGTGSVSTFGLVSDPNSAYLTGFGNAVVDARCGARHTVLLLANNTVRAFGRNTCAQLGLIGSNQWQPATPPINVSAPVVAISVSANSTLSEYIDRTTSAVGISALTGATKLFGGQFGTYSFVITPLGIIHSWGLLGLVPQSLASFGSMTGCFMTSVSAGQTFALASDSVGNVHVFGANNNYGQFGIGNTTSQSASTPAVIISNINGSSLSGVKIVQVCAAYNSSIALDSTGAVHTWGLNTNGQIGDGTVNQRTVPFQIMSVSGSSLVGSRIVSLAAGSEHVLAIDSNGGLHAWGCNTNGQLGIGTTADKYVATLITSSNSSGSLYNKRVIGVACGDRNSMALDSTGNVHTWGQNSSGSLNGVLGLGDNADRSSSVLMMNGSLAGKVVAMIASAGDTGLAIDSTGTIHLWGCNSSGNPWDGNATTQVYPTIVASGALSGKKIVAIAGSIGTFVALDQTGLVFSWGYNNSGQVGNNTTTNQTTPLLLSGNFGSLAVLTTATVSVSFTPFFVNFTGQHRVFVAGETVSSLGTKEGFIVVCDQEDYITAPGSAPVGKFSRGLNAITMNDTLPVVSLAKAAYDRRVFGVLSGSVFPFDPAMALGLSEQQTQRLVEVGDVRMEVNALGAGAVWVCDAAGPIVSGDLLTSSGVPGYGMLQAVPMYSFQSFTVGKATCSCDFTAPLMPAYEIKVDADGLNVLDPVSGAPLWVQGVTTVLQDVNGVVVTAAQQAQMTEEQVMALMSSVVPATQPKYQMRWVQADGTLISQGMYTDAVAAASATGGPPTVFRAAFLGCTYHCG